MKPPTKKYEYKDLIDGIQKSAKNAHENTYYALIKELEELDKEKEILKSAILGGNSKIITDIFNKMEEKNQEIVNGGNAIHYAVRYGNYETVKILGKKIDYNTRDNWGLTPMEWAKRMGKKDIYKYLKDQIEKDNK